MKAIDLATAAQAFLSSLTTLGENFKVEQLECRPQWGPMNQIFRETVRTGGGVYWFSLEDDTFST